MPFKFPYLHVGIIVLAAMYAVTSKDNSCFARHEKDIAQDGQYVNL
jgi:hypothetical protein